MNERLQKAEGELLALQTGQMVSATFQYVFVSISLNTLMYIQQRMEVDGRLSNSIFMSIGCRGHQITLSCSAGKESQITIHKATYGSFDHTCSVSCCAPNALRDCTEDMQTAHSDIFENLQQQCDGEQTCSFEFNGFVMDTSCNSDEANYLQVFYDCSNVAQGPVGFMV